MEIIALKNNDIQSDKMIIEKEKTLIVEMTQEEYQKCCVILYKEWLENE